MAATTTEYGKPMILYSDKASVFRVNNKHATTGLGDTQFARAMRCLNITPLCAETSQAKGRVERAHLTLQDRLVKELRLKGICTIEAANAFAEEYMADYNRRFAKEPLHDFNAYRPLALDDDLDAEFTCDEPSRRRHAPSINKSQRSLNEDDLLETMIKLQGSSEAIFGKR